MIWENSQWFSSSRFNKGSAEINVERGVDDWIESAVDVAEPSEGAVDLRRNVTSAAVSV